MGSLLHRRAAWLAVAGALALSGCPKKVEPDPAREAEEAAEKKAAEAEKARFESSWLVGLARDPKPLVELAQSSPGWRALFTGQTREALEAFEEDADKSPTARTGAARTALELARAHARIGFMIRALTPDLLKVQASRPGAEASAPWRAYIEARLAQSRGADPAAALARIPADAPAAPWAAALKSGADTPLGALLRGEAAGVDAELPPGGTEAYEIRLRVRALVAAGRVKEARARYGRLEAKAGDVILGEGKERVALRDPAAADVGARLYAALTVELLADASGWPLLLKADAQRMLGQPDAALATLDALGAAAPAAPGLPMLVLSDALDAGDLKEQAAALRARLLAEKGDEPGAGKAVDGLARGTIGQRVVQAWAGSFIGRVDAEAFPEDRTVFSRALIDVVTAVGEDAPGAATLAELMLVDRYVDAVQRRFADALVRMDRPALAVKMRDAAEDKTSAQAPSARNALSALTAAALDNVGIGRPRVALKYLSRMSTALPAADGPAEMLRDLLSHKAMEQGSGVTSGQ